MSEWALPFAFDASANPFRDKFGHLSPDQWCDVLVSSMSTALIEGVEFPRFPSLELQDRTHGCSGEAALREACAFYKFVRARDFFAEKAVAGANFLDFGTGWGRIARLFMRDFDLQRFYAFEPRPTSCLRARSLNPYLCVFSGKEMPDDALPPGWFDLVVGWSVFSHLSDYSTTAWLEELARITRPGAFCVQTTFGERFLDFLIACESDLRQGKEIHWYHKYCIEAAGDIARQRERYRRGEFVWIPDDPAQPYGAATFLHDEALLKIIRSRGLPFDLVAFDRESLHMDIFILRRR